MSPVFTAVANAQDAVAGLPEELRGASILIVDDSMTIRKAISRFLVHNGFEQVFEAEDGRKAIAMMGEVNPDLIITDLNMPDIDGLELCRRLRADARWASVPILVQTGTTSHDQRGEVFFNGATDLISKPINLREMIGRVRVHLEQRRLVRKLSDYQQSMAQQLDLAREMQESLLPGRDEVAGIEARLPIEISSSYRASLGLGGDLWGAEAPDPTHLHVFMADFTGHGVSAALNTFRFHSFLRNEPLDSLPSDKAMATMNRYLAEVLPTGQFATFLSARIDFEAGQIEISSANGPAPILRIGPDGAYRPLPSIGFPLGVLEEARFTVERYPFPVGSMLLLYSDALTETPLPPDAIFTASSLADFLNRMPPPASAHDIKRAVMARLKPHVLEDDLTIVVIRHLEAK
jgi:phosphoserine phosphatase RsbU/P